MKYMLMRKAGRVFRELSEGGTEIMPFEKTFWAHRFGMTTDRFGVQWMISAQLEHCQ